MLANSLKWLLILMICSDASSLCILCSGCDDALSPTLIFHFNLCPWDLGVCFPPAKSWYTKFQHSCTSYPFLSCQIMNLYSWLEIPGLYHCLTTGFSGFVFQTPFWLFTAILLLTLSILAISLWRSVLFTDLTSAACYHTHSP